MNAILKLLATGFSITAITVSYAQTNKITDTGYIGIGTISPVTSLHVKGGPLKTYGWSNTVTLQANYPAILFNGNNSKWAGIGYDYGLGLRFWLNANSDDMEGNGPAAMSLLNNGNVGIGTIAPTGKLDVRGVGYFNNPVGQDYAAIAVGASGGAYGAVGYGYRYTVKNDTYTYAGPDNASQLFFYGGGMRFRTAPVGIINDTVSFTDAMTLLRNGNFGIGVSNPDEKLVVNGKMKAKKLIITETGWADHVFTAAYRLKPLSEVASFIRTHGRLPEVPSATEVKEKGISVGETQALLLQKIEELTLYLIEMKSENEVMRKRIGELEKGQNAGIRK